MVGQGLIGLLTAAVLADMGFDVTAVDISSSRLESAMNFCRGMKLMNPQSKSDHAEDQKFDVVIEVSGR